MDLFKEVLKDDGLKLEAKTVFIYKLFTIWAAFVLTFEDRQNLFILL